MRSLEPSSQIHIEHDSLAFFVRFFFKCLKVFVLFITIAILVDLIALSALAFKYLSSVSASSSLPVSQILSIARTSLAITPPVSNNLTNFLLLGVDSLSNRDSQDINTDTIMILSVNSRTHTIHTFSIPRDLYLESSGLKINGLYNNAVKNGNARPELSTKLAVETLTGLPIHYVIVLELDKAGTLIDALGGLDVDIQNSFTDTRFPRSDIDIRNQEDPSLLYETITFNKGIEHMSGNRALKFIRSRHSNDTIEGSDDARIARQKQVVSALVAKLKDPRSLKDPVVTGRLLSIYQQTFASYVPLSDLLALIRLLLGKDLIFPQFITHSLDAFFYHPERFKTGQWVYLPHDPDFSALKSQLKTWLE